MLKFDPEENLAALEAECLTDAATIIIEPEGGLAGLSYGPESPGNTLRAAFRWGNPPPPVLL